MIRDEEVMNLPLPQRLTLQTLATQELPLEGCAWHFAKECAKFELLCGELGHLLCPGVHEI